MSVLVGLVSIYIIFGIVPGTMVGLALENNREAVRGEVERDGIWMARSENRLIGVVVIVTIMLWPVVVFAKRS